MTRLPFALALLAAAAWVGSRAGDAVGCAVAPHPGQRVDVSQEAAYIVWDEKEKTEHFVRRATFNSTSTDFGFLVPTPTRPELEVADESLFSELTALTAPKVEYREVVREVNKELSLGFGFGRLRTGEFAGAVPEIADPLVPRAGDVQVLDQKRVGDYDATVLTFRREPGDAAGRGAAELTRWLAKHGYQSSGALAQWLERYVQDQWCVTAFKIAADASVPPGPRRGRPTRELQAKPIRMSFKTERPFYPYREPESEPAAGGPSARSLRVFLAAPARFAGVLGDGSKPWAGQVVWSGPVEAGAQGRAFELAKLNVSTAPDGTTTPRAVPAPEGWWMTEFEDRSSPRSGADELYFARSTDQTVVAPPPDVVTTTRVISITPWWHGVLYYLVPVAFVVVGLLSWRRIRRASAQRPPNVARS